jgi:hypothetical protein
VPLLSRLFLLPVNLERRLYHIMSIYFYGKVNAAYCAAPFTFKGSGLGGTLSRTAISEWTLRRADGRKRLHSPLLREAKERKLD